MSDTTKRTNRTTSAVTRAAAVLAADKGRLLGRNCVVSNDTRATGLNNNDLIVGSSGAGKTGGYVIPNIERSNTSMIVADTKSLLYRKLSDKLRQNGYDVYVLDFVNPMNSCSYNPLSYIEMDEETGEYREQDVSTIATSLIPEMDKDEPIWTTMARTVLECMIAYVVEAFDPADRNMDSVLEVFKVICAGPTGGSNERKKFNFLEEWSITHPTSYAVSKYRMLLGNMGADKMWSSVIGFVIAGLREFSMKESRKIFGNDSFRIEDIGRKKTMVFLNVSDTDSSMYKLVNLFYTQALQMLCRTADKNPDGRLDVPVRIFLDDFAANAYIPEFERIISIIRSRDIMVSVILQSLTQLQTMYSEPQSLTILNNCDHLVYLGGNDMKTAEYVATRVCRSIETVLCLDPSKEYLITRGTKGELIDKIVPYSETLEEQLTAVS